MDRNIFSRCGVFKVTRFLKADKTPITLEMKRLSTLCFKLKLTSGKSALYNRNTEAQANPIIPPSFIKYQFYLLGIHDTALSP